MKKKLTLLITASILTIAMLGACSSTSQANQSSKPNVTTKKDATSNNKSTSKTTDTKTPAKPAAESVVEVTVNAKNNQYDKTAITVKKGEKVKISLHSINSVHGLTIPAYNVNIQGNGSAEFTATKVGKFEFHCPGHPDMKGTLIVQ